MVDTVQGLRPDGRLVIMGAGETPLPLSPLDLLSRRIRIIGSQQNGAPFLHEALEIAAKGKVKVIAETYPLRDIVRAYERVEKGVTRFRAVIVN